MLYVQLRNVQKKKKPTNFFSSLVWKTFQKWEALLRIAAVHAQSGRP